MKYKSLKDTTASVNYEICISLNRINIVQQFIENILNTFIFSFKNNAVHICGMVAHGKVFDVRGSDGGKNVDMGVVGKGSRRGMLCNNGE